MAALQTLLSPQVLTDVISQQAASSDWLATLFGVQPGGKNVRNYGHGREGSFNIFDNTRKVGKGRAPGTAAARSAPNPIGKVTFTYPRLYDSVPLSAEVLHNLGRIDNPSVRDRAGADMISRQTGYLGQLAGNWRKAMLMGTLRDSLYLGFNGDDQFFQFSTDTPAVQLSSQIPSGNKDKLDMLGGGDILATSWATTTTDIPGHIGQINAAFQQLCGGHLAAVICGTKVWNAVIKNEHVRNSHGSSNQPFVVLERDALEPSVARTMKNVYRARLSVYPDVIWYITDEGLDIGAPGSEAYTKIVPDNYAMFCGFEPDDGTLICYEGSEPVAEYDGAPESVKVGLNAWSVKRANPTTTDLFVLDNALTVLQVPKAMAYGLCIY